MKKILTLLAIFMVAMTSWAETSTYTDSNGVVWTNVSTADDFYEAINKTDASGNHNANVRLTADIDLSSHSSSNRCIFDFNFTGKITGAYTSDDKDAYHALMNSNTDLLFNYLTGAEISDLCIYNCTFQGWDTHSGWIGTQAYNCKFTNIQLQWCSGTGDSNVYEVDNIGGLIGISHSCEFTNIQIVSSTIETDGAYAGLIVGSDESSTFTKCYTLGASGVWADGNSTVGINGNAYCGGLCGSANGSTFTECVNSAMVGSKDDRTGGIVGYGVETTLDHCKNAGIVCHVSKDTFSSALSHIALQGAAIASVTGLAVYEGFYIVVSMGCSAVYNSAAITQTYHFFEAAKYLFIKGAHYTFMDQGYIGATLAQVASNVAIYAGIAASVATIVYTSWLLYDTFYAADEIGGIAGTLKGSSLADGCTNFGSINCQDVECGGIVGYLDGSTVQNCLNRGLVDGANKVGGIAGYCCNSATLNGNINLGGINASSGYTGHYGYIYDVTDAGSVTSTNNYYVNTETTAVANGCKGEIPINFATGSVALAINTAQNGTAWRQDLENSMYPTPEKTASVVTAITTTPCTTEKVYNAKDFYACVSNPLAQISVEANLDLTGLQCFKMSSYDSPFRGKITGNGHKLSNVSYEVPCSKGNNTASNAALFPYATGATFENFTIANFNLTQHELDFINIDNTSPQSVEALLVANSYGCTYTGINIINSSILLNDDKDHLINVGGLVANSTKDTFTGCSLDSETQLQAYSGTSNDDILLGGIAGTASGSTFTQCYSSATLWGDDNRAGGIAGNITGGSIDQCLNTGCITAQEEVGGIVGYATNASIRRCVNTGVINDDENKREDDRAGVAGILDGSNASIDYCWNFGSINYVDNSTHCWVAGPMRNGAGYGEHNYWYCQYNGKHEEKLPSGVTYADITSGKYANTALYSDSKTWLYQYIDNSNSFPSHMPVPIPSAGTVYSDILCDGTQSYSNVYKSTASHTSTSANGICTICGELTTLPTTIHVTNGVDLNDIARFVNSGKDYSSPTIYLDNDIDMNGFVFTPIGNADYPFKGTFDGNGHRIRNLAINGTNVEGTGLFGFVGPCTIQNTVIDKSCSVEQSYNQLGTAGLIGCVKTGVTSSQYINIYNCGNEANVTSSGGTAAGILGDIRDNDRTVVHIYNCYNSGNITGKSGGDSGSIIGYARKYTSIDNTWNSGTISGNRNGYPFAGTWDNAGSLSYCYDVNTQDGVRKITNSDVKFGTLWNKLTWNLVDSYSEWTQDIGTDSHPTFGSADLHYSREMTNNWGTIVLPFDITYDADNTDYNLYYLSAADDDNLTFTEYADDTTIKAGTPMAVKVLSGDAIDITAASTPNISTTITAQTNTVNTSMPAGWTMDGAYTQTNKVSGDETGVYFIARNQFWYADAAITIAPFRAWFEGPVQSSNEAKSFTIVESDEADGIDLTPALSQGEGVRKYLEGGKVVIVRNGKKFNINGQVLK